MNSTIPVTIILNRRPYRFVDITGMISLFTKIESIAIP